MNLWFSNRGQIAQLVIASVACLFAGLNAWPAINNLQLFALGPVLFYLVLISAAMLFALKISAPHPTPAADTSSITTTYVPPASEETGLAAKTDTGLKGTGKIIRHKLTIGQVWDMGDQRKITFRKFYPNKVEPKGIQFPVSEYAVELDVAFGGRLVYWGQSAQHVASGRYAVPIISDGFHAEPGSLYAFSYSKEHINLEVLSVEHLNPHSKEIDLVYSNMRVSNYG